MSLLSRVEPRTAAVGAAGVLIPLLVIIGLPQPVQAVFALALMAVLPGYALARLMQLREDLMTVAVSVAASLALATMVSTALLYLGLWSWQLCAVILGVVTLGACAARLRTVS